MADAVTVGAVLNAASLELGDHLGDVHGHGAELGVRHEATGTEDLTNAANLGHHVRRSDSSVEVDLALLDLGDELVGTDDVGAGSLGLAGLLALGEDSNTNGLAGAVRQEMEPRMFWSALRVSMPRRKWASTVSSNLAVSSSLMSLAA